MGIFRTVGEVLEKKLLATMTRKLVFGLIGNAALTFIGLVLLWLNYRSVAGAVYGLAAGGEAAEPVVASLRTGFCLVAALLGCSVIVSWFVFVVQRAGIVEPVQGIVATMQEIGRAGADLSRNMPVETHDEIGELAAGYNAFMDALREILWRVRVLGVDLGVASAVVVKHVDEVSTAAKSQRQLAQGVFSACELSSHAVENAIAAARTITATTTRNV
ncbi:MAG: HAMP domain-containing protein [Deltaproteobacteria bacterium]|nr:HAMP domain-containing protein [Candidatus Anaeroferrophillacea bacterium]